MAVRAKFKVTNIEPNSGAVSITLFPVTDGSEENKEFFKWTPGGQINLGCCNPAATEQFEVGQEFYVDFTPADDSKL